MIVKKKSEFDFVFDCKSFMERKGFSINELSEKLDVSANAVLSWKNGKSYPKIETILKFIDLGATIFEIFGHDYAMKLASNTSETCKPVIQKRSLKK